MSQINSFKVATSVLRHDLKRGLRPGTQYLGLWNPSTWYLGLRTQISEPKTQDVRSQDQELELRTLTPRTWDSWRHLFCFIYYNLTKNIEKSKTIVRDDNFRQCLHGTRLQGKVKYKNTKCNLKSQGIPIKVATYLNMKKGPLLD